MGKFLYFLCRVAFLNFILKTYIMEQLQVAINSRRKIFAIQQEFNSIFPNLKVEFFSKPHTHDGKHSDKINSTSSHTLGDCRTVHSEGVITIQSGAFPGELEQLFGDEYGLKIHVLKKVADSWEVVSDSQLTLEQLNAEI